MGSKSEVTQEEHGVAPVKQSKKRTCMRHCKRFWWIYLIVFCCIVVLVVCLVIFVAVPEIAQDAVNDADLDMQGINILEPDADSYIMEINSTISTSGDLHADVDGFEGVLYLEDWEPHTPFARLTFPETNGDAHQEVNVSQTVDIFDLEEFTRFNTWFTLNETLRITVEGDTQVQPAGLDRKYDVDFKKTVTLNGLHLFEGTNVTGGEINLEEDAEYNFLGTADIPNHSIFTLDIGNLTFTNYANDQDLGTLRIENLILVPGMNSVELKGNLDNPSILNLAQTPEYCETGIIPFQLEGREVVRNGVDLPYFRDALAAANQTVEINIGAILARPPLNYELNCGGDGEAEAEAE